MAYVHGGRMVPGILTILTTINFAFAMSATRPIFIGEHTTNEGGMYVSAVTFTKGWFYEQKDICKWPSLTYTSETFGNHQAAFARSRGFLYKGLGINSTHRIVRVTVADLTCEVLPSSAHLPFLPGEFWIDFFPDQSSESPMPTVMAALQGSPTNIYVIMKLKDEFSNRPEVVKWMEVKIPHQVRQIFGSFYDSETQHIYVGFNEGHLFWDVPPSWLFVIDVKAKRVVSQTFNEHLAGFDIWYDAPLQNFYVLTMNDCAENCTQGVRLWTPGKELPDVKTNLCDGTACFTFQVGYGYSYMTQNHTGVFYGGVSGWWYYNVQTGKIGQLEYTTVFPTNPVYIGPLE